VRWFLYAQNGKCYVQTKVIRIYKVRITRRQHWRQIAGRHQKCSINPRMFKRVLVTLTITASWSKTQITNMRSRLVKPLNSYIGLQVEQSWISSIRISPHAAIRTCTANWLMAWWNFQSSRLLPPIDSDGAISTLYILITLVHTHVCKVITI
jgi:hypothetical protein